MICSSSLTNKYGRLDFVSKLNDQGYVNILSGHYHYLTGTQWLFEPVKKKILIYNFKRYIINGDSVNPKIVISLFLQYFSDPLYLGTLIILTALSLVTVKQYYLFLFAFFLNVSVISSLLIHELGHYLFSCLLRVPSAFRIQGKTISLLYKTDNPIKSIFISLGGFISNLLCASLLIFIIEFTRDPYLKALIIFCFIIHITLMTSIIPIFRDGKNIISALPVWYNLTKERSKE